MLAASPPMLYRQYFTLAERQMLDASPLLSALNEINLLRVLLSRLMAAANKKRLLRASSFLAMLSAVSTAGVLVASLVRLHCNSILQSLQNGPLDDDFPAGDVEDL